MNFELTEDRRMLADTLGRFLSETYDLEARNRVAYDAPFHAPAKWAEMAELGIPAALASEDAGGFGGGGFDISVVFEELGRVLCPEPFLGTLMASRLLSAAGQDQAALLDGSCRHAVCLSEIDAPYDPVAGETSAIVSGDGRHLLTGRKSAVYGGQAADRLLVVARLEGRAALFALPAADADVVAVGMIDGAGMAEVRFENTPATLLLKDASRAVQDALNAGRLALCAEAVGTMGMAYDLLLDYMRQRRQFGVAIGQFQALQHRVVDLLTEIEQARSMVIAAAAALDEGDGALKCAMAKALIGQVARQVAEETVQMHGGIAMTWDYAASHYAKRLVMIDHQLGDTDHCLQLVTASYST